MAESSLVINSALKNNAKQKDVYMPSVTEIEKQYVKNVANDLTLTVSGTTPKKKVRRKPRVKNSPSTSPMNKLKPPNDEMSQVLNEMQISAINSHATGCVLHVKRHLHKRINTKLLNHLNGSNVSECSCNCHTRQADYNSLDIRGNSEITSELAETSSGIKSQNQRNSPVNCLNLQFTKLKLQEDANTPTAKKKKNRVRPMKKFANYPGLAAVQQGLKAGLLIQGTVRINAKNFREAYVTSKDDENDYLLQSVIDRNRALDGDVVAIKLKPEEDWTDKLKTAYVVQILEHVHPRTAVGFLQSCTENDKFASFIPRDQRVPRMRIPIKSCPQGFIRNSHRFENILFRGKIVHWLDVKFAKGQLLQNLGTAGDLESETAAIFADNGLDGDLFKTDVFPKMYFPTSVPQKEFAYRIDIRKECVFTIDPATARDLDDAVSCKQLSNGNFEVGVHISDVSFYVKENNPLNTIVCKRATTIYMVNNVYHMLPEELCMLCSLLPGEDKLAFSVFWELTKTGKIISKRFARTIINSCTQLAYEHAQVMIDDPNHVFGPGELPQIHGGFTVEDLSRTVNNLQAIAVNLRKQRFETGALRIDQTKLLFRIDPSTGEPSEFFVYENKEANRLIEEFMLLANISVATQIANAFPNVAFLRCHDPPKMTMLMEVKKLLKTFDVELDVTSSKTLQASMWSISEQFGVAQMAVVNHLLAKPMMRARYFCSGESENNDFNHYALSVPIYTHFTSPIRRYADIMVHRLLSASLHYTPAPPWTTQYVTNIAKNCNQQKQSAKLAGEASCDLYLAHYVAEHQPFVQNAVVINIKYTSFEILVYATGSIIKMFNNNLGEGIECQTNPEDKGNLTVNFKETSELPALKYEIKLFSLVTVALRRKPKTIKLDATLLRPLQTQNAEQNTNLD